MSRSRAEYPWLVPSCSVCLPPGDVLLAEQLDCLGRLNAKDWAKLKAEIAAKRVRVVALDLPTSYQLANAGDDFSSRMLDAINGMMLDMLAAIARKDYEDRRRRQAQGIAKAKAKSVYKGIPEDAKRNAEIMQMIREGKSWNSVMAATRCSRSTISRLLQEVRRQSGAEALG